MRINSWLTSSLLAASAIAAPAFALPVTPLSFRDFFDPNAAAPLHGTYGVEARTELEAAEPRDRLPKFDVQHYDLAIHVDPTLGTISGTAKVSFQSLVDGLGFAIFDARGMQIDAVKGEHGEALPFTYDGTLLTVTLTSALERSAATLVSIQYRALMAQELLVAGPDATNPAHMPAAYTYTEPEGASSWFPCLDRPADKATSSVTISVPQGFNALSNGDLVAERQDGAEAVFSYRMDFPIATYLMSLNIGKYEISDLGTYRGKAVRVWAPPAIADKARFETSRTVDMMEAYTAFTGFEYPFHSYTQSVAEAYKTSMEHQSATTMGGWRITGDGSGESVIAHELAHQWFGDWVTCRTWGELWLNEGFASYLPYVFFSAMNEETPSLGQLDYWRSGYFEEAQTRVHALSEANPDWNDLFDAHAYEKGALVIHLLRHVAGNERFSAGLKEYLTTRGGSTGTSYDLQGALERATGSSWQLFFDQWVRSAGHPVLTVTSTYQDGNLSLTVEQTQATRADRRWRTFSFPLTVEVLAQDGAASRIELDVYADRETFTIPLAAAPKALVVDPDLVIPAEITLEQSAAAWTDALRSSPETTARLTALSALQQLAQGVTSPEVLALVLAGHANYVKIAALELWSGNDANRSSIVALYQALAAERDLDVSTRGALARTEQWLVSTIGTVPSRDDERHWQDRYVATPIVAERKALLGMLATASMERAQVFAAERIREPQWVMQDRNALIDLLTKAPTDASSDFIVSALDGTAPVFLSQILRNLIAANYDHPSIVLKLANGAQLHRYIGVRVAMTKLLGKQSSSKVEACPTLTSLAAGDQADVRAAATEALQSLQCASN